MRTVGPSPATIALAAAVFSPIFSSRSSRTCTWARRAVSQSSSASRPEASCSLRRKSGRSSTGQSAARSALNATTASHTGSGHQPPATRWMPSTAGTRGNPQHEADARTLGAVGRPPRRRLAGQAVSA